MGLSLVTIAPATATIDLQGPAPDGGKRKFGLKPEEALLILADLQTKGMFRGTGIDDKARAAVGLKPVIDVTQINTIQVIRDRKTGAVSYEVDLNFGAGTKTCSVEG